MPACLLLHAGIVKSCRRAPEQIETLGAIAPHRIQRIGQTKEQRTGATEQGKPEQRAEDGIIPIFQHRLNAGLGDAEEGLFARKWSFSPGRVAAADNSAL